MLDQPSNSATLLIKEALHIHLSESELSNRYEGIAIPDIPILNHVTTVTSHLHAMPVFNINYTGDGNTSVKSV